MGETAVIINNLNAIGSAYNALRSNNLVRSTADFSKWYLAKSDRYLRSMQARSRTVPDATVAMLEWALQRELLHFSLNPHLGQAYAISLNAGYDCLQRELLAIRRHRDALRQVANQLPANSNDAAPPPAGGQTANLQSVNGHIPVVSSIRRL
jgi:hypothetical protein